MRFLKQIILSICLLAFFLQSSAQQNETPPTTRILFILDASGSMYENMDGRTRIVVAKEILSNLIDSLRDKPNLEVGLRVFGHQFDKKYQNCQDTKLEVPFSANNHDAIIKNIKSIDPKGTTLIANSIEKAANDFPKDPNSRNVLLLITDGIEACGGDPCAISLALQKKNIFLKPFIIGLGSNPNFDKAFSCMGQYFDASNASSFRSVLGKVMEQTLGKTTVRVNLLDSYNKPTETNVNMSFVNTVTKQTEYDFVHQIGSDGKSDLLDIDPVLSYDIVVNTIPKVVKRDVYLEGGKENVINIKTPQGIIYFKGNNKEYKNLQMLVRKTNGPTLNVQRENTFERYIVGTYEVEILTVPRTVKTIQVKQDKNTVLEIDPPGALNIMDNIAGYGSIYQIKSNGEQEWVCNLENDKSNTSMGMQPGKYKLVFRSKKASGSKHTDSRYFTINSGATTNIRMSSY